MEETEALVPKREDEDNISSIKKANAAAQALQESIQ